MLPPRHRHAHPLSDREIPNTGLICQRYPMLDGEGSASLD
jgi:hypothetical protein